MAIIKCVECNGTVSDKAKICPHCGVEVSYILENSSVWFPSNVLDYEEFDIDFERTNIIYYPYEMKNKNELKKLCNESYPNIQLICIDDIDAGDEKIWYEQLQMAKENEDAEKIYKYYKLLAMHRHRCCLLAEDRKNMYEVGRMTYFGIGTDQNLPKALFWLSKAIEKVGIDWKYYSYLGEEPPPASAAPLPSACLFSAQICLASAENDDDPQSMVDTIYALLNTGINSSYDYYYDEEEQESVQKCVELMELIFGTTSEE